MQEAPFLLFSSMIKKALRDEGTSYHYLPPKRFAKASPALMTVLDVCGK